MMNQQTGVEQIQDYLQALSRQLHRPLELYGLDTAKTEALMQWASMETVKHSQNISQARVMLMHGLKAFGWIMNEQNLLDIIHVAMVQATGTVRMAAIVRKPGKPPKVVAWLR